MPRLSTYLKLIGVEIIDARRVLVKCRRCGQVYSPTISEGGKITKGGWRCPNGCSERAERVSPYRVIRKPTKGAR